MGNRKGFLGDGGTATFIIVQLVRERIAFRERWFIFECTRPFDDASLKDVLNHHDYSMATVIASPLQQGFGCQGRENT